MLIALVLIAAWIVLNLALFGAVAYANHAGQRAAARPAVAATPAPVFVLASR